MRIVQYPHPSLRHPAKPISSIDRELRLQIGRMFELMYAARGLGLAAPQVALPYQLLVMNLKHDANQPEAERIYINPRIVERKGTMDGDEGCLSFPGLFANVKRAKKVVVEAFDGEGHPVRIEAEGLESRAWQHEIDHLNGVVFIERFGPLVRLAKGRDVAVFERKFRRAQEKGEIPPDVDLKKLLADLEQGMDG